MYVSHGFIQNNIQHFIQIRTQHLKQADFQHSHVVTCRCMSDSKLWLAELCYD